MGLDPPIPVTGRKATRPKLEEAIRSACKQLEPGDEFTSATLNVLTVMGIDLTKEPETQQEPEEKGWICGTTPSKKDKPVSGCGLVMRLVCENPEITKQEIRAALDKGKFKIKDSSLETVRADTLKVIRYLIETGKLTY